VFDDGVGAKRSWAIIGRFLTQRMTGVQRYARRIVAALDGIFSKEGDIARRLGIRLVLPPGAKGKTRFFKNRHTPQGLRIGSWSNTGSISA